MVRFFRFFQKKPRKFWGKNVAMIFSVPRWNFIWKYLQMILFSRKQWYAQKFEFFFGLIKFVVQHFSPWNFAGELRKIGAFSWYHNDCFEWISKLVQTLDLNLPSDTHSCSIKTVSCQIGSQIRSNTFNALVRESVVWKRIPLCYQGLCDWRLWTTVYKRCSLSSKAQ